MTETDDRDLAAPFETLTAPRSTASYGERSTRSDDLATPAGGRRWPQALASILAVVVALAGAATFLALRSSRQDQVATGSGYPAARAGAAMAYDSTAGVTVMYGGMLSTGRSLSDTWAWNGSSWGSVAGASPGPMAAARLSDDPADGGVLLLGLPMTDSPPVACAVAGSAGSGSGTATGGTVGASEAPGPIASAPLATPPPAVSAPPGHPATPPEPGLPTAPPASVPWPSGVPITSCALPSTPPPSVQTWLFTARGWARVASSAVAGGDTSTPAPGSQLAYDATTGEVVAVSAGFIPPCGPPLAFGAAAAPGPVCPLAGSGAASSSSGAAPVPACAPPGATCAAPGCGATGCVPDIACRVLTTPTACPFGGGSLSTWTWSHGRWTQRPGGVVPSAWAGAAVFGDPLSGHATLVTQTVEVAAHSCVAPCPGANVYPMTRSWTWGGTSWTLATGGGSQPAPSLAGASIASAGGRAVVLTAAGELWTWSGLTLQWTQQKAAEQPDFRGAAALATGPGGTAVVFGGVRFPGPTHLLYAVYPPGADTWTWNGSAWKHVAGTLPTPLPAPTGCPGVAANSECPYPGPPTIVPPATPRAPPTVP